MENFGLESSILFTFFTWMAHEFELNIFKLVWIPSQNQLSSMAVQNASLNGQHSMRMHAVLFVIRILVENNV